MSSVGLVHPYWCIKERVSEKTCMRSSAKELVRIRPRNADCTKYYNNNIHNYANLRLDCLNSKSDLTRFPQAFKKWLDECLPRLHQRFFFERQMLWQLHPLQSERNC